MLYQKNHAIKISSGICQTYRWHVSSPTETSLNGITQRTTQLDHKVCKAACADPESFIRGGPNLITFFLFVFLVDEGIEDPNVTINGPSSARQRNAILMAFRWQADDDPTLNAGLVAS